MSLMISEFFEGNLELEDLNDQMVQNIGKLTSLSLIMQSGYQS